MATKISDLLNEDPKKPKSIRDLAIELNQSEQTQSPMNTDGFASADEVARIRAFMEQDRAQQEDSSRGLLGGIGDLALSGVQGAVDWGSGLVGLADIPISGLSNGNLSLRRGLKNTIGYDPEATNQALEQMMTQQSQDANRKIAEAEGFFGTLGEVVSNPFSAAQMVVRSAPGMLGSAGIGRALAGRLGTAGAAVGGEAILGAGNAASSIAGQTDGSLTAGQALASIGSGAATGLIGKAANKLTNNAIGQRLGMADVDEALVRGDLSSIGNAGAIKNITGGAIKEGLLEEMPQAAAEQSIQNAALGKDITEGVPEAAATGLAVGGMTGGAFGAARSIANRNQKPVDPEEALNAPVAGLEEFDEPPQAQPETPPQAPSVALGNLQVTTAPDGSVVATNQDGSQTNLTNQPDGVFTNAIKKTAFGQMVDQQTQQVAEKPKYGVKVGNPAFPAMLDRNIEALSQENYLEPAKNSPPLVGAGDSLSLQQETQNAQREPIDPAVAEQEYLNQFSNPYVNPGDDKAIDVPGIKTEQPQATENRGVGSTINSLVNQQAQKITQEDIIADDKLIADINQRVNAAIESGKDLTQDEIIELTKDIKSLNKRVATNDRLVALSEKSKATREADNAASQRVSQLVSNGITSRKTGIARDATIEDVNKAVQEIQNPKTREAVFESASNAIKTRDDQKRVAQELAVAQAVAPIIQNDGVMVDEQGNQKNVTKAQILSQLAFVKSPEERVKYFEQIAKQIDDARYKQGKPMLFKKVENLSSSRALVPVGNATQTPSQNEVVAGITKRAVELARENTLVRNDDGSYRLANEADIDGLVAPIVDEKQRDLAKTRLTNIINKKRNDLGLPPMGQAVQGNEMYAGPDGRVQVVPKETAIANRLNATNAPGEIETTSDANIVESGVSKPRGKPRKEAKKAAAPQAKGMSASQAQAEDERFADFFGNKVLTKIAKSGKEKILKRLKEDSSVFKKLNPKVRADFDIALAAVQLDDTLISSVSPELQQNPQIQAAAKKGQVNRKDKEKNSLQQRIKKAIDEIKKDITAHERIDNELKDNKEFALALVSEDGYFLSYLNPIMQDDRDVVLAAVKNDKYAFGYASERLRDDKEIALIAVSKDIESLKIASNRLRNDEDVVMEAININASAIQFASDEIRGNKRISLIAVNYKGNVLQYLNNDLKSDKEVVLAAVKNDGIALEYADGKIKNDNEVVIEAVKSNGYALEFTSEKIQNNKEIVLLAMRSKPLSMRFASKSIISAIRKAKVDMPKSSNAEVLNLIIEQENAKREQKELEKIVKKPRAKKPASTPKEEPKNNPDGDLEDLFGDLPPPPKKGVRRLSEDAADTNVAPVSAAGQRAVAKATKMIEVIGNRLGENIGTALLKLPNFKVVSLEEAKKLGKEINERTNAFVHTYNDGRPPKIYFVAENMAKQEPKYIAGTILHEVAVHAWEMGSNSPKFQAILKNVNEKAEQGKEPFAAARKRVPENTPQKYVEEETLAYLLTQNPASPLKATIGDLFMLSLKDFVSKVFSGSPKVQKWATDYNTNQLGVVALRTLKDGLKRKTSGQPMVVSARSTRMSEDTASKDQPFDFQDGRITAGAPKVNLGTSLDGIFDDIIGKQVPVDNLETDDQLDVIQSTPNKEPTIFDKNKDAFTINKKAKAIVSLSNETEILDRLDAILAKIGIKISANNKFREFQTAFAKATDRNLVFANSMIFTANKLFEKHKISVDDFDRVSIAMHAGERNRKLAAINPQEPADKRDRLSGMSDQEAKDILSKYVDLSADKLKEMTAEQVADYAFEKNAMIKDIVQFNAGVANDILGYQIGYQLEDYSIKELNNAYKYYVPLVKGNNKVGAKNVRSKGNADLPIQSPFGNLLLKAESVIFEGEANAAKARALTELARNSDGSMVRLVKVKEEVEIGKDGEPIKYPTIKKFDKDGKLQLIRDPSITKRENVVTFKINGEQFYAIFNKDNEVLLESAKAMNNFYKKETSRNKVSSIARMFTTTIVNTNTRLNPFFPFVDIFRNSITGFIQLQESGLSAKEASKVIAGSFKDIVRIMNYKNQERKAKDRVSVRDDKEPVELLLYNLMKNAGGTTGYRDLVLTGDQKSAELKLALKNKNPDANTMEKIKNNSKAVASAYIDFVADIWGASIEESLRFSTFKETLKKNLTPEQYQDLISYNANSNDGVYADAIALAARESRNVTVDFGKKGRDTKGFSDFFPFFNAAIQGSTRIFETMFDKNANGAKLTKTGQKVIIGGLLMGMTQGILLAMAGIDDDEITEFTRENNFIIPWNGRYIQVPLPYGYSVIHSTGLSMFNVFRQVATGKSPRKIIDTALSSTTNVIKQALTSFNPMGGDSLASTLTPGFADPIVDLYANKDGLGRSIYNEDFNPSKPTPGYERAKTQTPDIYIGIAKALDFATGGFLYKGNPGVVSPPPEAIKYLVEYYLGSFARTPNQIGSFTKDEELQATRLPLVGRFIGNTDGSDSKRRQFYEANTDMFKIKQSLEAYKEAKDTQGVRDLMKDKPEAKLIPQYQATNTLVTKLRKRIKELEAQNAPEERINAVKRRMDEVMFDFLEKYKKATD